MPPIATFSSDYLLEPVSYGLKLAGSFSGGILLKTEFSTKLQAAGVNATAYAAKLPGGRTSVLPLWSKNPCVGLKLKVTVMISAFQACSSLRPLTTRDQYTN